MCFAECFEGREGAEQNWEKGRVCGIGSTIGATGRNSSVCDGLSAQREDTSTAFRDLTRKTTPSNSLISSHTSRPASRVYNRSGRVGWPAPRYSTDQGEFLLKFHHVIVAFYQLSVAHNTGSVFISTHWVHLCGFRLLSGCLGPTLGRDRKWGFSFMGKGSIV